MSREVEEHLSTADIAAAADRSAQPSQSESQSQSQVPVAPRADGGDRQLAPLFEPQLTADMRDRWTSIQAGFVDDPHRAVQKADELVAQALQDLARSFARHRTQIEEEAKAGQQEPSTESLRVALQRYRSFFERLLSL
jgi:hypothetical protein